MKRWCRWCSPKRSCLSIVSSWVLRNLTLARQLPGLPITSSSQEVCYNIVQDTWHHDIKTNGISKQGSGIYTEQHADECTQCSSKTYQEFVRLDIVVGILENCLDSNLPVFSHLEEKIAIDPQQRLGHRSPRVEIKMWGFICFLLSRRSINDTCHGF